MQLSTLHDIQQSSVYQIWRGESVELGQRFTVKELRPETRTMPVHVEALERETQFLLKFKHQRILAVASHESPDTVLLEDAQCSLQQLLKKHGVFSNELVALVLGQCLEALAFLASKDHAHGMLCSENVFVDPAGGIKLGDFTGYRFEKDKAAFGHFYREPLNPAPEIIDRDCGPCGPWSDLYCLGFIALEMLAGNQLPQLMGLTSHENDRRRWQRWHADSTQSLENWQEQLPDVSAGLGAFIDGLIRKNVSQRAFQDPAEALKQLHELGLGARRALPMFDQREQEVGAVETRYCPPKRKLGPILRLVPRNPKRSTKPIVVPQDQPLIVKGRKSSAELLSLLSCQTTNWFVYNLAERSATFHNNQAVPRDSPRKIAAEDELRFGEDRYLVDLVLQGTSVVRGFDLLKRIHRGSGGELYRARWYPRSMKERLVAVRLLAPDFGRDVDQIRRFLRAIPSAGRIRHANVVRLFKGGRVRRGGQSTWYIASQLMPGGSLRDRIRKRGGKGISLRLARTIGLAVASALTAARNHRVVHRNINPACILFDNNGGIRLGDFSLLRTEIIESMFDITRGKLLPGDYLYQAPEILAASSTVDQTCDFFSLGACLHEAILGKAPVDTDQPEVSLIRKLVDYEWPGIRSVNSEIPQVWEDALSRCMRRNPAERFSSPEELFETFQALPVAKEPGA